MQAINDSRRQLLRAMAALGAVSTASLAGCGGGGGAEAAGETSAGSLTIGPITGFGSVIVNGVTFDETSATVTDDDDMVMAASALQLGMTVEVDSAVPDEINPRPLARAIRFGWEIVGPVSAVDPAGGTMVVLDQTVRVGETTHFGEELSGGLAGITIGAVIAVNGFIDVAASQYVATRVEARPNAPVYRLRGRLADLDTTAKTCRIGGALISFADLGADKLPRELREGMMARATLHKVQAGGRWVALMIRHAAALAASLPRAHVRGAITEFVSAQDFKVNGLAVDARAAVFPDGRDGLALGVRVEVLGLLRDGVLVAARVELDERHWRERHGVRIRGSVGSVDLAARKMRLRGVPVAWDTHTVFEGGVETDLVEGKQVELFGLIAFDRRIVHALKIRIVA